MNEPSLHVRIISPQKLILETDASSVSSSNTTGPFDILAQHANFITLIEDAEIIIRPLNKSPEVKPLVFKFALAIISAGSNKVNIYTNIQEGLENKEIK